MRACGPPPELSRLALIRPRADRCSRLERDPTQGRELKPFTVPGMLIRRGPVQEQNVKLKYCSGVGLRPFNFQYKYFLYRTYVQYDTVVMIQNSTYIRYQSSFATPCPLLEICRCLAIQNVWRKTPYNLYGRDRKPPNKAVPPIQN